MKVVYQSVDTAADWLINPKAISGKGSGADRMISAAQASLFTAEELGVETQAAIDGLTPGVWFFCVSVDGDDVRAELSLPSGVARGNFDGFIERIFIIRQGEWASLNVGHNESGSRDDFTAEFEPVITRK